MPKRAQSLRIELLVTLTLLVGLAVMSLSLVTQALAKHRHDQREVDRLSIYAQGVASLVSNHFLGPEQYDREAISDLLNQSVSAQFGIRSINLFLVDTRGARHIVSAGATGTSVPPSIDQQGLDTTSSVLGERLVFHIYVPIFGGDQQTSRPMLRITAIPEAWVESAVLLQMLGLSLSIILLMLLAGNFLMSGNIFQPLRQLREATRRVANGDLQSPIPEEGPLEFQNLAHDFNAMVNSLATEREENARQAAALRRSEQLAAVGQLSAGVAHEIGNPLAAVHGYVEFLLDPREGVAHSHREILQTMVEQTDRIRTIVAQMLDYSRPRPLRPESCMLGDELRAIIEHVSMDRRAAEVKFGVDDGSDLEIEVDTSVLQQIVMNLLVNAAIATADSATPSRNVRVRIEHDTACARVIVTDNGPGIPPELHEKVFEPFFTTRPVGQGSGLGLAVSRGLAERLNGTLQCVASEDTPPDPDGACFVLTLPLTSPPADEATIA
ncbi:MAG: ATP-binding protein [Nannocystaceae bacterium]